jgi:phospholipid/cholesterol/gamma-HCH transport system substrate-binding protein
VRHAIAKHLRDFIAVAALGLVGLSVAAYVLSHQRLRFPIVEEKPFVMKATFSDAQGVMPGQGQTVRIAGMQIGDITDVELRDGKAVVKMEIEQKFKNRIHKDATALLRPRTGLKDMFIALDPGTRAQPVVGEDFTMAVADTLPDVDADEILTALDGDTRDYLKLLLNGVGKGLEGRSDDLREVFRRLGPLFRDITRLQEQVALRRRNLARLIHNYGGTIDRLGREDKTLTALVRSSRTVFGRLSQEDANISTAVSRLPGTLTQARDTLTKVQTLGEVAGPAFESLRPVMRKIPPANAQVKPLAIEAEPTVRTKIRPFVRTAVPYVKTLKPAVEDLEKASPNLRTSFYELNRFFNMLSYNPKGREALTGDRAKDLQRDEGYLFWLAWVSQNTVSIFSTGDANGPYRRIILGFTCSALQVAIRQEPANELILAASDALNTPGLCPAE